MGGSFKLPMSCPMKCFMCCLALMFLELDATDTQARVAINAAIAQIRSGADSIDLRSGAGHYVGDSGAIAISMALAANGGGKVKTLDLSVNDIGDIGAKAVADMLSNNTVLSDLRIGWNEFGLKAMGVLFNAVAKGNNTLHRLAIPGSELGDEGARQLRKIMATGSGLQIQRLDLSHNQIGTAGRADVSAAVVGLTKLTHCDMRGNHLNASEWQQLQSLLEERRKVVRLEARERQVCVEQGSCSSLGNTVPAARRNLRKNSHDEL